MKQQENKFSYAERRGIKTQNYAEKFCVVPRNVPRGFAIIFVFCLLLPFSAKAAILYLEPASGEYYQGDTFIVNVRIDTENECINTIQAELVFSNDVLEVKDFSIGSSIISVWLKTPQFFNETGSISFAGGIPGGYCGILPGDPGKSNLLGKLIFRVVPREVPRGSAEVIFKDDSQVLLNDGLGTPAKLTRKGAVFTILPEKAEVPKEEWQEELKKDNIPPEPFEIEIHQDPMIFDGKWFITFFTVDKQTGIDHYEIAEQRRIIRGITRKIEWKRGESPYLLEDQTLKSIIKVRAVDKSGNERIAEYRPPKKITWKDWLSWIVLVLILGGIIWWIIAKLRGTERRTPK